MENEGTFAERDISGTWQAISLFLQIDPMR
jgi:hypothetical protein